MNLIPRFLLNFFKKEPDKYETIYQNAFPMSKQQKELLKSCKRVLIDNGVALNKLRFVFEPSFMYDIDNNKINPVYKQLVSQNKKAPIIEINAPHNVMTIYVGEYRTTDNFSVLKTMVKKTKVGIVVLINEIDYNDVIWLANLDDAIEFHYNNYEYQT